MTTAPAPTTAFAPMRMPGSTTAPIPTNAPAPIRTAPPSLTPGATCEKLADFDVVLHERLGVDDGVAADPGFGLDDGARTDQNTRTDFRARADQCRGMHDDREALPFDLCRDPRARAIVADGDMQRVFRRDRLFDRAGDEHTEHLPAKEIRPIVVKRAHVPPGGPPCFQRDLCVPARAQDPQAHSCGSLRRRSGGEGANSGIVADPSALIPRRKIT